MSKTFYLEEQNQYVYKVFENFVILDFFISNVR